MDFWQAWEKFVKAYKDQETKEVPTILGFCDFKQKKILDVGAGTGRLAIRFAPLSSKLYALDKNENLLEQLKESAKNLGQPEKIETAIGDCQSMDFPDGSFDVVYSAWVLQSVEDVRKAVEEMVRVTNPKGCIINVLASERGDETKIRSFYEPKEAELRANRVKIVKQTLEENGCKVVEKKQLLDFYFNPPVEDVYEILLPITFGNKKIPEPIAKQIKGHLERGLQKGKLHFTQGASFVCGYKSN